MIHDFEPPGLRDRSQPVRLRARPGDVHDEVVRQRRVLDEDLRGAFPSNHCEMDTSRVDGRRDRTSSSRNLTASTFGGCCQLPTNSAPRL